MVHLHQSTPVQCTVETDVEIKKSFFVCYSPFLQVRRGIIGERKFQNFRLICSVFLSPESIEVPALGPVVYSRVAVAVTSHT